MAHTPRLEDPVRELRDWLAAGRYRDVLTGFDGSSNEPLDGPEVQLLRATAATRLGRLAEATRFGSDAVGQFRRLGDADGEMRATNLLGAIDFELGRLDRAEQSFGEALRLAQQLNDSLLAARASNNLAAVAQLRGKPDRALGLYQRALLAYQRLGDRRGLALTHHNLGLSFRQMAQWREAEAAAVQAVRLAELEGEGSLLALTLTGKAELNIEREELDLAAREIERAIRAAEEADDELGAAEARRLRAWVALRRGDYLAARDDAEASRAVAVRHGSALLEAESAAAAALALRGLGLLDGAAKRRAEAIRGFQALGATAWLARFETEWPE